MGRRWLMLTVVFVARLSLGLLATIIDPRTIQDILASLGVPSGITDRAPPIHPARAAAAAVSGAPA